jgi:hypothetical protein
VTRPQADTGERLERLQQLIEHYRAEKRRQLFRRAVKLWRKTEADQRFSTLDPPRERVD